jgi:hypothetical protein
MEYKITKRQRSNAKKLGVTLRPSSNTSKKLDVFKNGKKIFSIGAMGYRDYDSYLADFPRPYANERRRLYKLRHQNNRTKKDTAGFYADRILW